MKKPRFKKEIDFGFGYKLPIFVKENLRQGKVKVSGLTTYQPGSKDGNFIEIDGNEPTWDQMDAYAHEVIHAAIEFHRWVQLNYVVPMAQEAARTEVELEKDKEEEKGA